MRTLLLINQHTHNSGLPNEGRICIQQGKGCKLPLKEDICPLAGEGWGQ